MNRLNRVAETVTADSVEEPHHVLINDENNSSKKEDAAANQASVEKSEKSPQVYHLSIIYIINIIQKQL